MKLIPDSLGALPALLFIFFCVLFITKAAVHGYRALSTWLLEPQYINPSNYCYKTYMYHLVVLCYTCAALLALSGLGKLRRSRGLTSFRQRLLIKIMMIAFGLEALVSLFTLLKAFEKVRLSIELAASCVGLLLSLGLDAQVSAEFYEKVVGKGPRANDVEV